MQDVAESQVGVPAVEQGFEDVAIEPASSRRKTIVIVLVQVVALAAFAIIWSILRSKRSTL